MGVAETAYGKVIISDTAPIAAYVDHPLVGVQLDAPDDLNRPLCRRGITIQPKLWIAGQVHCPSPFVTARRHTKHCWTGVIDLRSKSVFVTFAHLVIASDGTVGLDSNILTEKRALERRCVVSGDS